MPIRVQNDLPVKEILEHDNIFVMDEYRAAHQDIRPIKIGGYRAADPAVSLEHTTSSGCCVCPCIRTCIEKYIHQPST